MFKIIPNFDYKINIQGSLLAPSNIKDRLLQAGAIITSENHNNIVFKVSSNALAASIYPLTKDLILQLITNEKDIELIVTRSGEKKAALFFLSSVTLLSIAICLQEKSLSPLIFPIISYIIIYLLSLVPTHPAHKKIRKLLFHVDEIK